MMMTMLLTLILSVSETKLLMRVMRRTKTLLGLRMTTVAHRLMILARTTTLMLVTLTEARKEKSVKKEPKKGLVLKGLPLKKKALATEEGSSKKKTQKKKKDPNAPKKAMSGFMYFSQMERDNIKKSNPGIGFGDIGKVLGDKWRQMSAEEKEPYEAKAQVDKSDTRMRLAITRTLSPCL
uniref:HMG box domain-containing protein n=1 Tax=Brassica oleracea TaxID=3712 RepID=A0A3P6DGC6_BRAOL|nr:unnamed protein product [Brassica oleracea]